MAKKSMVERETKRKFLIDKFDKLRQEIRINIKKADSFSEQLQLQKRMQKLPRNSARCRHRNRCWASGRSRGFYRDFGLSRHVFREMSHQCLLPGVQKSSW